MAGIIAMAPLFVGLLCRYYPAPQFWVGELKEISLVNQSELFLFKLIATAVLATAVTLLAYNLPGLASHFAIFTLLLPIMWIAFSESPLRTALSVSLLSFYIAFLVNMLSLMEFVLVYQLAICVIAASAFFYISIPSLMANNHSLRRRATTDNLTGIATRDYFMERSDLIINNARQNNGDACFVILDVDEFKLVNDKYGHASGDRVLLEVCRITKMQLRHTDIFGRYGGDEFVIMMPDTTLDLASIRVNRILEAINHIVINDRVMISASAGIASMDEGDSLEQLFDRADSRLYRAKNSGRNKVVA
jgi:diguanylate cyclase (GGDEF)-like protein